MAILPNIDCHRPSCRASRAVRVPFGTDKSHALPTVRDSQFPAATERLREPKISAEMNRHTEGELMPIQGVPCCPQNPLARLQ
jgi:hypothetical protein